MLVDPKVIWRLVVGDVDIDPAITIEVGAYDSQAVAH